MAGGVQKTINDNVVTASHNLSLAQSFLPCALGDFPWPFRDPSLTESVTSLFFLWGFAYGLLDVLNSHFQTLLNLSAAQASGLTAAYFGAYALCPLTISGWILRRFGFRITFVAGLSILCVGCLLFWPSGVKQSFGGFCGSMFVVGSGLSTLETAADPFLAICGPPRYSEIRLNLAQAVQGVGSLVAPLLASYIFFAHVEDTTTSLRNVQWVYLGIACFVALLAIVFFFVPIHVEVTDADMAMMEHEIADVDPAPFKKQYNLFLGTSCQFFYVGAQASIAAYFINFCVEAGVSKERGSKLLSAAQGIYAGMRFISGFAMMSPRVKPRWILLGYLVLCFIFAIAAMNTTGTKSIALFMTIFACESAVFATCFTTALRGLGRHTKYGGSMLVAAISGATVVAPAMGAVVTARSAHFAMIVPAVAYLIALVFPIYVNFFNAETMDLHRASDHGIAPANDKEAGLERANTDDAKTGNVRTIEDIAA